MIRITGGNFKNKPVECLEGKSIRPTSSKTRQGIFNVLFSMGFEIEKARVLELFAGTGLISFESLSRGAVYAVLVDNSRVSLNVIEKNTTKLGVKDVTKIILADALNFVGKNDLKDFDIIYLDPPYDYKEYDEVLNNIFPKMKSGAILIAESGYEMFKDGAPSEVKVVKIKRWGKSFAHFVTRV
ncbi:MAG: 16S rRNA (guanine(966)-N(2))-methyltransferase RsmD [Pseudomonadota bacterium]